VSWRFIAGGKTTARFRSVAVSWRDCRAAVARFYRWGVSFHRRHLLIISQLMVRVASATSCGAPRTGIAACNRRLVLTRAAVSAALKRASTGEGSDHRCAHFRAPRGLLHSNVAALGLLSPAIFNAEKAFVDSATTGAACGILGLKRGTLPSYLSADAFRAGATTAFGVDARDARAAASWRVVARCVQQSDALYLYRNND